MTDPQTMQEIKAALAERNKEAVDKYHLGVSDAPTTKEMERLMEEERTGTKPMMPTTPADKPKGLHQLFTRDELIPLKGVWFKATEVEEEKLVLVPTHFTKNFTKRNK